MGGFEQRKAPRVPYTASVKFTVGGRRGDFVAKTMNLSETGLAFRTDAVLEKEQMIEIRLLNPDTLQPVTVAGHVVDCAPEEAGAPKKAHVVRTRFLSVSEAARKVLVKILEGFLGVGKYQSVALSESVETLHKIAKGTVPVPVAMEARELSETETTMILESRTHVAFAKLAQAKQYPKSGPYLSSRIPVLLDAPLEQEVKAGRTILLTIEIPGQAQKFQSLAVVEKCPVYADAVGKFRAVLKVFSIRQKDLADLEKAL